MKRVICFDLWNTLINTPKGGGASYEDVLEELGVQRELIYPVVRDNLMTGKFTYLTMVDLLFKHFGIEGHNKERQQAAENWENDNRVATWFSGARKLLQTLKEEGAELVLVSNISLPAWQTVGQMLGIAKPFNHLFLSCKEGLAKPDPRVWQMVESWYGKEDYWMIGDNEEDDLLIPRKMGWRTVQVSKNGSDVIRLLEKLRRKK